MSQSSDAKWSALCLKAAEIACWHGRWKVKAELEVGGAVQPKRIDESPWYLGLMFKGSGG